MSTIPETVAQDELPALARLARESAQKVFDKLPILGPVAWLMMQQAGSRHTLLSELEWRVMPALALDQAKLYLKGTTPIAFVSWARLGEAAAERYCNAPHHLASSDWTSGDQVWLVDILAPFGNAKEVFSDVRENMFAGQVVRQLLPDASTRARVMAWPAA
ncbi:MAG: toxin-activating lysine-acyltransferase [Variovorax sp.]